MEPIKSKKELEREARNQSIREDYLNLLQDHPEAKPWRILRTIADKYDMTPEGVKFILMSMDLYKTTQEA